MKYNLTGKMFGELTVLKRVKVSDTRHAWLCRCSCGTEKTIPGYSLLHGHYKSCRCKHAEKRDAGARKHIDMDKVNGTRKTALTAKLHINNSSGVKGVRFNQQRGKWTAHIGFRGRQMALGYFVEFEDAVNARKKAEDQYFKPILEEGNTE